MKSNLAGEHLTLLEYMTLYAYVGAYGEQGGIYWNYFPVDLNTTEYTGYRYFHEKGHLTGNFCQSQKKVLYSVVSFLLILRSIFNIAPNRMIPVYV